MFSFTFSGLITAAILLGLPGPARAASAPMEVKVDDVPNDDGRRLEVRWRPVDPPPAEYRIERAPSPEGPWESVGKAAPDASSYVDVFDDANARDWYYRVAAVGADGTAAVGDPVGPVQASQSVFNSDRTIVLLFIVVFSVLIGYFLDQARRGAERMYIRRIPGIDAIEEAVGRATEMGRPVLYVPGIEEMYDIQTIASMLILGKVAEMVAEYNTEIIVANRVPFVMTVAEEVVRQGFYNAGRPEAHKPENIRFISDEQFAFTAGTNGIMLRERPATNLYLGRFFAESLILAETGFQAKAIQVAGTAEVTQLPFFIAACDYTLIGEELFAASAYLSREPRILSTLKAADWFKVLLVVLIVAGALSETFGWGDFKAAFEVK
ncbi:MAG: fibronectin type III domain-containing protein [Deltaproteobacteria bacterium]|nr:MAG: fibronectin type III domain-containing protein [Deltaproteobacteria bacterium]